MSRTRVESFSDGVFTIAITLLVLTIGLPNDYSNLSHELADRWPSFAAYVVSFAIIGVMWLNHHSIFSHFERIDRGLVYLNLLLLMTIAFLPYAVAWGAMWLYASSGRRLLVAGFPEAQRSIATVSFLGGGAVYVLTVAVAFVNAYACLAFHAALAVYYALDPLSRFASRTK
jgi:uncharacterized membrane protein